VVSKLKGTKPASGSAATDGAAAKSDSTAAVGGTPASAPNVVSANPAPNVDV